MSRKTAVLVVLAIALAHGQTFDLLLKGGHVLDPANGIDGRADVAISGNRIAAVAPDISPADARRVLAVNGFYVTPGLIDLHTHVYVKGRSATVLPDDAVLPHGTTTIVDAGVSGWKTFDDFHATVIRQSKTRVLALLNIVGGGMNDEIRKEDLVDDMDPRATARKIGQHPDILVGVKTAHFGGVGWTAVERALEAGRLADKPVMLDSHIYSNSGRNTEHKLLRLMRPGDLHTHTYNDQQLELVDRFTGKVQPWMLAARQRGVLFDLGHGGGSFLWPVARAAIAGGFPVDTISTDLHTGSILLLQVNMANAISKLMALGMPLPDAILRSTLNPAKAIHRFPELGTLGKGQGADVAVFELREGVFAYVDSARKKLTANRKLECVLTVRNGEVVFDRDARTLAPSGTLARLGALPPPAAPWPASVTSPAPVGPIYDLVLKRGYVIDPANRRLGLFDIAINGQKITRIASDIPAVNARLTVDLAGYFVTPGLIDLGADVDFLGSLTGVQPDHHSLPYGVTTVTTLDASREVIRRSRTLVLSKAVPAGVAVGIPASGINRTSVLTDQASMTRALTLGFNGGTPLAALIEAATVRAAKAIGRPDLGTLVEGGAADLAVFAVERGAFPMVGADHRRFEAKARINCVLTFRQGDAVWDLHGLTMREWSQAGAYSNYR